MQEPPCHPTTMHLRAKCHDIVLLQINIPIYISTLYGLQIVQPEQELVSRATDLQGRASNYRLTAQSLKQRGWNKSVSSTVALTVRIRTV